MRTQKRPISLSQIAIICAILLLLAWALFPVRGSDGPYFTTQCLSQVKQLATGTAIYAADWDDRLMDRDAWMDQLVPYRKNASIEHCPAVVEESKSDPGRYGYAFNGDLSNSNSSKRSEPDKIPMLYDSESLWRNASDLLQSLPSPPRKHRNSLVNTVAFLDAHARSFRSNALIPGVIVTKVGPILKEHSR